MTQTNLTIRIDEDIKQEAENLFRKIGLNMSSAINVFFRQAVRAQAIPFELKATSKYDEYFNAYNMKILEESVAQAERGEVITFSMAELEAMESGDIPQRALDFLNKNKNSEALHSD